MYPPVSICNRNNKDKYCITLFACRTCVSRKVTIANWIGGIRCPPIGIFSFFRNIFLSHKSCFQDSFIIWLVTNSLVCTCVWQANSVSKRFYFSSFTFCFSAIRMERSCRCRRWLITEIYICWLINKFANRVQKGMVFLMMWVLWGK